MLCNVVVLTQNEDLAQLAAQQYYVEHASDMNIERLVGLVPNYIPDACLQGTGTTERWAQQIVNAYRRVSDGYNRNTLLHISLFGRLHMCVIVLNDPVSRKKLSTVQSSAGLYFFHAFMRLIGSLALLFLRMRLS